jgi:hypothetical protein
MRVTIKKYGVSISFCRKLTIFAKNRWVTPMHFE